MLDTRRALYPEWRFLPEITPTRMNGDTMPSEKLRRFGAFGLGSALLGVVLVALILAVSAQSRRITALEGEAPASNQAKIQEINMIKRIEHVYQQEIQHIEKRIESLGTPEKLSVPERPAG